MGKYYIWFVVVVAGLAGVIRVLLPRRFAELQLERFKAANAISKAKIRSLLFLAVGLVFGGIYFVPWGHQIWIIIGTIFSLLSAAEAFFQAQFSPGRLISPLVFDEFVGNGTTHLFRGRAMKFS